MRIFVRKQLIFYLDILSLRLKSLNFAFAITIKMSYNKTLDTKTNKLKYQNILN